LEKRYDGMAAADAHLQRISDHVSAYLQIVRSQLLATVPKGVVHCMVVPAKETLLSELQEEIAGGWGLLHVQGGGGGLGGAQRVFWRVLLWLGSPAVFPKGGGRAGL
jgi:hypothetical protein